MTKTVTDAVKKPKQEFLPKEVSTIKEQLSLDPNERVMNKSVALSGLSAPNYTLRMFKAAHVITFFVVENFLLRNPSFNHRSLSTLTEDYLEGAVTTFDIPESVLMEAMGYTDKKKYYSMTQVLTVFEELSNQTLRFDTLGVALRNGDTQEWNGFTKLISSVKRIRGAFRIHVPPAMTYRILNPETSLSVNLSSNGYTTRYAPPLYESCLYYWQSGRTVTDYFDLDEIRAMFGVSYRSYGKLNEKVISVAINNINDAPEMEFHLEKEEEFSKTGGRPSVVAVRFKITRKVGFESKNRELKRDVALSTYKTEMGAFGVARNQLDAVVDESRTEDGSLCMPYLSWCIRRGREMHAYMKAVQKEKDEDKTFNYGGWFRKHIINAAKDDWMRSHALFETYATQKIPSYSSMSYEDKNRVLEDLKETAKDGITNEYISLLSDSGYAFFVEQFQAFLKMQDRREYEQLVVKKAYGQGIADLNDKGRYSVKLYLDAIEKLFTAESYEEYLKYHEMRI